MLFNPNDPEDSPIRCENTRRYTTSIAFARATSVSEEALKIVQRDTLDKRAVKEARSCIRKLKLLPSQLYNLIETTRVMAFDKGFEDRHADPNKPMSNRSCTYGQWRAAAWLSCRAATSLLAESYRPTEFADFFRFAELLSRMAGCIPLPDRERRRIFQRLKQNFAAVYWGLPVDYYVRPQRKAAAARAAHDATHRVRSTEAAVHASV